jgi:hypothetical protein
MWKSLRRLASHASRGNMSHTFLSTETSAQHALSDDRCVRHARFAAAEARAVGRPSGLIKSGKD